MEKIIFEQFNKIKKKFPKIKTIKIEYRGSGDSLDDMWVVSTNPEHKLEVSDISDLIFEILGILDIYFDNEGCSGTITIDLKNKNINVLNTRYYTESIEHSYEINLRNKL